MWFRINEIQANPPRNQDQGVCYHRQMPETRTMVLESGPRYLKSRLICTAVIAGVPEILGEKIKASMPIKCVRMPEIQAKCAKKSKSGLNLNASMSVRWVSMPKIIITVPKTQNQGVCYHKQIPETRTVCLGSGLRYLKSRQMCTGIIASVP